MTLSIKFKRLHPDAKIPTLIHETDTGWDVYAIDNGEFEGGYLEYKLGFAVQPPAGYGFQLRPRSSISSKDLILCNSPGTIDQDYRGEMVVRFKIIPRVSYFNGVDAQLYEHFCQTDEFRPSVYTRGDRIAQLVLEKIIPCEFVETETLDDTERGGGGFGSTGA